MFAGAVGICTAIIFLTVATPDATAAAAAMAPNAGHITGIPDNDLYAATAD